MISFHVIGAGGTGGYLIPILARMLNSSNFTTPSIYIYDDDSVEHKNIQRQNFIEDDIGYTKAHVLASRYSAVFPNVYFESKRQRITSYDSIQYSSDSMHVVLNCVDSVKSRQDVLLSLIGIQHPVILIDSGNEDQYGHVTLGIISYKDTYHTILTDTFMNVLENKTEIVQGSCATLGEQTLIQNHLQASVIMKMLLNITNIFSMNPDVNSSSHPLNQISSDLVNYLGDSILNNKLLVTTYNTGGLSSKNDAQEFEKLTIRMKFEGGNND